METFNKSDLRERVLDRIKYLSKLEKKEIEHQLREMLFHSQIWKEAKTIGITFSTDLEWDTTRIIEQAWKEKKIVAIPKVIAKEKRMTFHRINSFSDVKLGYANIKEPIASQTEIIDKEQIDLLIVPGVVFDVQGYRIGFGGGYYDRFLSDFKQNTLSLVSELQLMEQIPKEDHDIPVQYIVSEARMIKT